ncbi:hypothetical protein ACFFOM_03645 [Microlunatus capsulatus]|uniref:Magnesium transporter NIPA n=1 Tax=Microlunatus capsulatus TaxID=99117 RepID=A0ABS4Z361_9ACTN|nr:hypothetical protein [Microlunatus capsulatus]MBP2415175.1 hypothetical protein [Microlunatus capsulatus]
MTAVTLLLPGGAAAAPVVAVLLALAAAVLFGLAAVAQHGAVRRLPARSGLRALLRSPRWLVGAAQTGLAGGLHLAALALAPVALVQPLGVLAVPVAVLAHARGTGRLPGARPLAGAALSVLGAGGLTLTLLLAGRTATAGTLPGPGAVLGIAAAALAVPALVGLGRWLPPASRAVASALTGAALFGLTSVLVRTGATGWAAGRADLVAASAVVAGVLAAAGLVAVQRAHRTGTPALVVCCLTLADPLVATAGAGVLLHEAPVLAAGPAAAALLACLLAAAGVGLLAREHPDARRPSSSPHAGRAPTAPGRRPPAPALTRSPS